MDRITIRPMLEADLPRIVDWLNQPHVAAWFHEHPPTIKAVTDKYLPRITGESPTKVFVSCHNDQPIGMVQAYSIDGYPDYAQALGNPAHAVGIDVFIGDPDQIHKGLGPKILQVMSTQIVAAMFPGTEIVLASPSIANTASIEAFRKAGFEKGSVISVPGEDSLEQVMIFDRSLQ